MKRVERTEFLWITKLRPCPPPVSVLKNVRSSSSPYLSLSSFHQRHCSSLICLFPPFYSSPFHLHPPPHPPLSLFGFAAFLAEPTSEAYRGTEEEGVVCRRIRKKETLRASHRRGREKDKKKHIGSFEEREDTHNETDTGLCY